MSKMEAQLVDLLNIYSPSGEEGKVRDYLKPILEDLLDKVFVDKSGNLLGEKKFGNGDGATVLLSAHMDNVHDVLENKKLIIEDGVVIKTARMVAVDNKKKTVVVIESD